MTKDEDIMATLTDCLSPERVAEIKAEIDEYVAEEVAYRLQNPGKKNRLNSKDVTEHIAQGAHRCPYCNSDDIQPHKIITEDGYGNQRIDCQVCERSYEEVYKLVGVYCEEAAETLFVESEYD
jgi:transposase-like protein